MPRLQQLEQRCRWRHADQQLDVGMRGPEGLQVVGEMDDRCRVDHAQPHTTGPPLTQPIGPPREIRSQAQHLACMRDDGDGSRPQVSATGFAIEEGHAEPAFEFGESL